MTDVARLNESTASRELEWLINEIRYEINESIVPGIEECLERLCELDAFKLVMSSAHSEKLKGTVTRSGSCLIEADLMVRLKSIGRPVMIRLAKPLYLKQIVNTSGCLSESLNVVSRLDLPSLSANNTQFHVHTLLQLVENALSSIQTPSKELKFPVHTTDLSIFKDLSENVSVDFYISDNSVVIEVHHYEDEEIANSGINQLWKKKGETVKYKESKVYDYEKIVIESQDPNLISVTTKLRALQVNLQAMNQNLTTCRSVQMHED